MVRFARPFAALSLAFAAVLPANAGAATPMKAETRAALVQLRDAVRTWAPMCANGAMGLTQMPECKQGDMLEYAGMSCLAGERERCEDVRRSQSADGRFWRNPASAAAGKEPDGKNSFSRDMLMGVFDYVIVTGDKAAFERFISYVRSHRNRMCPDATDNRCRLVPSTWGLVSLVAKRVGMKRPLWMKMAERTLDIDLTASAASAPKGYMMELVAHHILVRRALGQNTRAMRWAANRIAKRQPLNPLFRFLAEGPSEEAANLARETCGPQKGALAHDFFFQRELRRNAAGQIVVIRDWKDAVPPLARDVASGHDCLIVLNFLLGGK
jgi:hypothetical protein